MANSWRLLPFGAICEHSAFGPRFSSDEYAPDGNVACLRTTDFDSDGRIDFDAMPLANLDLDRFRSHVLKRDDLVITRTGAYLGKVAVFTEFRLPVLPGAFSIRFRLDQDVADPQFIRYYFGSPDGQDSIQSIATGSVQPNLNITNLHALKVPLPPISEQRRIVEILAAFDDKIELNRRMNETLEAVCRATFKSWFVDFHPVCAKAALRRQHPKLSGAELSRRALPNLDAKIAERFPNSFIESELGRIPADWRAGSIGDVAVNVRLGVQPHEIELDTPYIGLEHMPRRSIALSEWGHSNNLESNKHRFSCGEILFGKLRPYFHKVGVAPIDGVCSTDILVIAPKEPAWFGFVLGHVSSDDFVSYADAGSTGTKMPRTNWHELARYQLAIPSPDLAAAFSISIEPLLEKVRQHIHETRGLATVRDALLPKLLSGDISVRGQEHIASSVL